MNSWKQGGFFLLDGLLACVLLSAGVLLVCGIWQQTLQLTAWQQKREEAQELALDRVRGEQSREELPEGYTLQEEFQPIPALPGVRLHRVQLYWQGRLAGSGAAYEKG